MEGIVNREGGEKKMEKHEERMITEDEFLFHMMAESERCTNALRTAKAALVWSAANTIILLAVILLNVL